jgi:hypothetical protein
LRGLGGNMAVLKKGVLMGDKTAAFVWQVIQHVNDSPPVGPEDICHACFPGYMVGCAPGIEGRAEWERRLEDVLQEVDRRMQVLHLANWVWRREVKERGTDRKRPVYFRRNDRRKIIPLEDLDENIRFLPFHDIQHPKDERFPEVN